MELRTKEIGIRKVFGYSHERNRVFAFKRFHDPDRFGVCHLNTNGLPVGRLVAFEFCF